MIHLAARLHAFVYGLFQPSDEAAARQLHREVRSLLAEHGLSRPAGRRELALSLAQEAVRMTGLPGQDHAIDVLTALALKLFDYESLFILPDFAFSGRRSVSQWWALKDQLTAQKELLTDFDAVCAHVVTALANCHAATELSLPIAPADGLDAITIPVPRTSLMKSVGAVADQVVLAFFDEEIEARRLFPRLRRRLDGNVITASGGNPDDPRGFTRAVKLPSQSDIKDPEALIGAYLGGTPLPMLFAGMADFALPASARLEHHHIVAGTGHGKTQALQYLVGHDLDAVARGAASVVVLDSQGDLINMISRLSLFAPGGPLYDRICIIDPTDVEWPVSLNLFDVGMERLNSYPQLERERLTNSILELYDFVLGSLLAAEMTQKQSVIFRYVTRLMLHIPNATIHTLRELMEPRSEVKFASHIAKLGGTPRHFFETEFGSKEFEQTRKQVLRRLWGILENQTFERMFSHPRSKLDLFAEMNAGKVILINTAKDLLKETGTEIFGRFFIALIAQAAQERAVLAPEKRMPTFVYIDEAADYFDHNIGIILSQARKYNVGMVLAHQYLGQLDPRLQEAFSANTSIKFAGGVSARDARALAQMMGCDPALIEAQPKLSFAASVRGITKGAVPLQFPYGSMEEMPRMSASDSQALRASMRRKYAVHYTELDGVGGAAFPNRGAAQARPSESPPTIEPPAADPALHQDLDTLNTDPSPNW
ncbi:type IV secretory system conjugative DNA transfer family protein [Emcibacter sp. SYSU 3D8]|uniref:type IV secretory system conjugative DNA transfer family protein n=1 Tax=Emcibacter sp. SYSU 3D8 TaxID=3133969 RepID=UPI0031FF2FB1